MLDKRHVTLPLDQIIRAYPGYWLCTLCVDSSRPGLGHHWRDTDADPETASIAHLRETHGLTDVLDETAEVGYLTQTDIARRCNVGISTVGGWLTRYRDTDHPFPTSCERLGERPRWRADQWPDIVKWRAELHKQSASKVGPTFGAFPPTGFVTHAGVGVWISKPGTWVKAVLAGQRKVHAPFPKPDLQLQRVTTTVPLWTVGRRAEVLAWYAGQKKMNAARERRRKRGEVQ